MHVSCHAPSGCKDTGADRICFHAQTSLLTRSAKARTTPSTPTSSTRPRSMLPGTPITRPSTSPTSTSGSGQLKGWRPSGVGSTGLRASGPNHCRLVDICPLHMALVISCFRPLKACQRIWPWVLRLVIGFRPASRPRGPAPSAKQPTSASSTEALQADLDNPPVVACRALLSALAPGTQPLVSPEAGRPDQARLVRWARRPGKLSRRNFRAFETCTADCAPD